MPADNRVAVASHRAPFFFPPPPPSTDKGKQGRRKINIEYIDDKSRRHITFSKRKAGIMKKAYELSTLTGTQVLLLVASETGHVYTFATPKLQVRRRTRGAPLRSPFLRRRRAYQLPDAAPVPATAAHHQARGQEPHPGVPQRPGHAYGTFSPSRRPAQRAPCRANPTVPVPRHRAPQGTTTAPSAADQQAAAAAAAAAQQQQQQQQQKAEEDKNKLAQPQMGQPDPNQFPPQNGMSMYPAPVGMYPVGSGVPAVNNFQQTNAAMLQQQQQYAQAAAANQWNKQNAQNQDQQGQGE